MGFGGGMIIDGGVPFLETYKYTFARSRITFFPTPRKSFHFSRYNAK
jgi:hypothetical protein